MTASDTIFALASAPGRAGVAVMRISGPDAAKAFAFCVPDSVPKPREAALREIRDPAKRTIDRALILWFAAPHSFTGENVVEFHLHGGRAIINAATRLLREHLHFRLAEPGEFTRRAFENGKLDLTEAEAVADLVNAETEAQHRQAMRQFDGELASIYEDWRARLTRILAYLEASIDFADEDLPKDMEGRNRPKRSAIWPVKLRAISTTNAAASVCAKDSRSPFSGRLMRENQVF